MRKHKTPNWPTKWGRGKWNLVLPVFFLVYLFAYLFWQLHFVSSTSNWLAENGKIYLNLQDLDTKILIMNSNLKGAYEARTKLVKEFDDFDHLRMPGAFRKTIRGIEQDFAKWKMAPSPERISDMRQKISGLKDATIHERRQRQMEFQTKGMVHFWWATIGMLALSVFFVEYWLRTQRLFKELGLSREKFKQMLTTVTLAEQRFRGLMESAHDLICITNEEGKIEYVNHQLAQSFGYMKEELIGKGVEFLVPDRYKELHVLQRANYMKSPEARPMGKGAELWGKRKDGTEIPVEISLSPFTSDGKLQVAAIIRDISDRKIIETRQNWLSEFGALSGTSLERKCLAAKLASFSIGKFADWCVVSLADAGFTVLQPGVDPMTAKWSSSNPKLGESAMRIFQDKKIHKIDDFGQDDFAFLPFTKEEKALILGRGIRGVVICPLLTRDGIFGTISFIKIRNNFTEDEVKFIEEILQRSSISLENARLYQISQQSIRMRDELLRIVSHDLKNPLNSIMLNAQVIERLSKANKDVITQQRVTAVERNTDVAIKLIKDLLDNAKIETGGLKLTKEVIDPQELIPETEHLFRSLAEEKDVQFAVKSEIVHPTKLMCDQERILQVISNLLGNSMKYTPKGGHVEVCLNENDGNVLISVKDDGPGMSKAKMEHLFEKYWRDEESGLMNLGLGLSIAKGIVEAHDGSIWVESGNGNGTKITFSLPCLQGSNGGVVALDSHH